MATESEGYLQQWRRDTVPAAVDGLAETWRYGSTSSSTLNQLTGSSAISILFCDILKILKKKKIKKKNRHLSHAICLEWLLTVSRCADCSPYDTYLAASSGFKWLDDRLPSLSGFLLLIYYPFLFSFFLCKINDLYPIGFKRFFFSSQWWLINFIFTEFYRVLQSLNQSTWWFKGLTLLVE